ncbi:hypothetical protein ACLM45_05765 [Synechococcus sp. A10-1-5-9]|uniref:hypothetical protein n=1 Tax=Synechococcus sp. A10-1-5-9 TaxID=3392295 RepID=UPI0039EC4660
MFGSEDSGVPVVGRREGYAAAAPSELDPRETANAINEIGARYILSRDGNLLPKDDFLLERPDVTPGEFGAYNAYRFDKELDFNPFDDGKMNLGILKTTTEGIHGPEAQLPGQTLSLNEAGVPVLGASASTVAGGLIPNIRQIRLRKSRGDYDRTKKVMINRIMGNIPYVKMKTYNKENDRAPWIKPGSRMDKVTSAIEDQFLTTNPVTGQLDMNVPKTAGLMAAGARTGLALGTAIGLGMEDQRRRDNFAGNNPGVDYDVDKQNARDLIDRKYELIKANPNAMEEKEKSGVGFSKRSQQEVLQAEAVKQQALINQLIDEERKSRALKANDDRQVALDRFDEIEASFER